MVEVFLVFTFNRVPQLVVELIMPCSRGMLELEARLEAELEELLAISAASGLSPQQEDQLDEVHREIARM